MCVRYIDLVPLCAYLARSVVANVIVIALLFAFDKLFSSSQARALRSLHSRLPVPRHRPCPVVQCIGSGTWEHGYMGSWAQGWCIVSFRTNNGTTVHSVLILTGGAG